MLYYPHRLFISPVHLYILFITFSQCLWFTLFKLTSFPLSIPFIYLLSASPANLRDPVHGDVVSVEDVQCTKEEMESQWPL